MFAYFLRISHYLYMKYILSLTLLFSLSACAWQQALYEKRLHNWHGKHRDELLRVWGQPVMVQPYAKDKEIYMYQYSRTVKTDAIHPYNTFDNVDGHIVPVRRGYTPARMRNERCEYRFIILPNDIIESVTWRGNACGKL